MSFDPSKISFSSEIQIDKILMVKSGSFSVAAPTGGLGDITREATSTFLTNLGQKTFFFGIFSLDNGVTWNDFNSTVVEFSGGNPVFQTCDVSGESYDNSFTVRALNWYNFAAGSSSARTVQYKVALIATSAQANTEAARSDEILQFNTEYNYQKILLDDVRTVTLASNERKSTTILHGLGSIPNMRGFIADSGLFAPLNNALLDIGNTSSLDAYSNIAINETSIIYTISNENNPSSRTVQLYTRVYYDA